jgi:hypothetical protein
MRVVAAADHVLNFLLKRLFHDQSCRQLHQLTPVTLRPPTSFK